MIFKKEFYHKGLVYKFNWSKMNHLEYQKQNNPCSRELWKYLNQISKGDFPESLFNDDSTPRISRFRLDGFKKSELVKIELQLLNEGVIREYKDENKLVTMAKEVFNNFKNAKIEKKPNHEVILKNILIRDEHAIATEIPVWDNQGSRRVTGHIDLIRINGDILEIIDYKPEGNFLKSIPQVAFYGLLMKNRFKLPKVLCYSFNKECVWEYEPDVVFSGINRALNQQLNNQKYIWQMYI